MSAPRLRLFAAGLSLVIAGCAPPPAPVPATPTVRITAPPPPTATTAPAKTGPTAHERIAAWEKAVVLKRNWLIAPTFDHAELGRFVASHARFAGGPLPESAVATDEGLLQGVAWVRLVSADKDVDGDGRVDLLVTAPRTGAPEGQWVIDVIADRRSGPAQIPTRGVEHLEWHTFQWLDSPVPTLVMMPWNSTFRKQVLTWDGKALAATDTVLLRWYAAQSPHEAGPNWFLTAIAAGKEQEYSVWNVASRTVLTPPTTLMDLRGDGQRYYLVRFTTYPPSGMSGPMDTSQLLLELRSDGWAQVSAPVLEPSTRGDRDANGVPDFECSLAEVELATCRRSDCNASRFEPRALVTWSGQDLSKTTPDLKPLYALWLDQAIDEVASLKTGGPSTGCPTERLDTAAKLYLGRRWSGVGDARAEAEAKGLLRGVSFAPCAGAGSGARGWSAIWKELKRELGTATPAKP